jgi:hypothetical protein
MRSAKIDAKEVPARISEGDILFEADGETSGCELIGVALFIRLFTTKFLQQKLSAYARNHDSRDNLIQHSRLFLKTRYSIRLLAFHFEMRLRIAFVRLTEIKFHLKTGKYRELNQYSFLYCT